MVVDFFTKSLRNLNIYVVKLLCLEEAGVLN
jgi:hypothetical protein